MDTTAVAQSVPPHNEAHRRQERLRDLAAFALIFVFALMLCAPVLAGRVPVASDTLYLWAPWSKLPHEPVHNEVLADSALHYLPWLVYSREAIGDGEWPLWEPYAFSGYPYVANSQNQLYYPLTWLRWLLPLSAAIQLLPVANICIAGWGMYVLMRWLTLTKDGEDEGREFGYASSKDGAGITFVLRPSMRRSRTLVQVSRPGALISALAFAGSGMMQLSIEATWVSSVYCWLPFMLYATDRALRDDEGRRTKDEGSKSFVLRPSSNQRRRKVNEG